MIFIFLLWFIVTTSILILFFESMIRGHDLPTSGRAIRYLLDAVAQHKPDAKTFYDLGCGHGRVVLAVKKRYPNIDVRGIDNGRVRIFFAKVMAFLLHRKVILKRQDIFDLDFKDADIVYTYLWYDLMPILEQKLQKELKSGAIVITNTSHFQNWQSVEQMITCPKKPKTSDFETLFIYRKA